MQKKTLWTISLLVGMSLCCLACTATAEEIYSGGAPAATAQGWELGCQAYSFNRFTFFEAVDKNASMGLKVIEAYPGQKLSKDTGEAKFSHDMSAEEQTLALDYLKSKGVTLKNYGVVGLPNDEAACRKVFDFAKKMGIETIVSEPPYDAFELLDKLTQEYAINVALHNHPKPSKYWNYKTVLKYTKDLNPRIGACADTGHWTRSGIKPVEAVKALEGRIISFHFKDLNEFGNKKAHDVIWGAGVSEPAAVLAEMKRQNFKGVFSIEYEHNWDNSVPEISQGVKFFNETAEKLAAK